MPAAMVHGGGGVLLMMTTKFALQETIKKSEQIVSNDCNAVGLIDVVVAAVILTRACNIQ